MTKALLTLFCMTLAASLLPAAEEINLTAPVRVTGAETYQFNAVPMGGIEQATGMVWCPANAERTFIRAEGGGIWRLDRAGNRWICLTDNLPFMWRDLVTVDSIAVHPTDANTIYIACGTRLGELHDVLKTTDGGKTWARLLVRNPGGKQVSSDGSGENRQGGERLAIDPNRPDVLWFATRNDGLLRSQDAGKTWEQIASFPTRGKPWVGLNFVTIDPTSGQAGQASQRIYVAGQPERTRGVRGGLYWTEDFGQKWTRVEDGPAMLGPSTVYMRGRFTADGTLYLTTLGSGAWKHRGTWREITPSDAKGRPLCGISIHPANPNKLLLAETNNQEGSVFYYSENGGESWRNYHRLRTDLGRSNIRVVGLPPWFIATEETWGSNLADIAFDPTDPDKAWHLSETGAASLTGLGTREVVASLLFDGREQSHCGEVVCPSAGAPLVSGIWRLGGFRHDSLTTPPARRFRRLEKTGIRDAELLKRQYQDVFDMDVQPDMPNRIVLCGGWQWNQTGEGAYSTDNGATFREFPTKPFESARFGRIAIGTNPANVVWAPMGNALTSVYFTQDNGQRWMPSDGAPPGMIATDGVWSFYRCLAADRVRLGTFYLYDRRDGRFYRSEDGGAKFMPTAVLPKQSGIHNDWHQLEATPWFENDIWIALRDQGLLHSTDGGKEWARINGVQWAQNITFGLPRKAGDYPAIYLFGQVGGEKATSTTADVQLYRSDDGGASWTRLNDDSMQFATAAAGFAADLRQFGRIFISTTARGVFYGQPAPQPGK